MTPFEKHFIQVGVIGRPKGTKGLLRFHSYLNDDRDVNQFKKFYLDNEETVNLKLVSFDKKSPLITIDEIDNRTCLLYTSPSPRDRQKSRMPSSA